MSTVKLTINGREVVAPKGQTILQAARKAGAYIPTLCYLSKTSPIGSCRLCVVEVEGTNGFVLSCQTPVKEGISVKTDSPALFTERQNIMAMYDVNHPLECGVCDKSGECELQNKTAEFKVSAQPFAAREQHRPIENWGFIQYDPSLCVLCERCVRVCNEVVGDNRLRVQPGGYKSKIALNGSLDDGCVECGECMAVCPVGALVSTGFKYRANAWELKRTPSTCAHCSAGCELFYETRHSGCDQGGKREIFRVTNDVETTTLCAAGRFGFGYENAGVKDAKALENAVSAFKKAAYVRIDGYLTNEEALLLQKLSDRMGFKLVAESIRPFQRFLNAYAAASGESLYNATVADVAQSDAVLLIGCDAVDEAPTVRTALNGAALNRRAQIVELSVVSDPRLSRAVTQSIRYEAGTEEGVLALLVKTLIAQPWPELKTWIDALDEGNLSAESNVGEEELQKLCVRLKNAQKRTIVAGADLYAHPRAEVIAALLGVLRRAGFEVLMVPPSTNALGVALICNLSDEAAGFGVGIRQHADVVLNDLPALSQQEGTITTLDKTVKPLNAALAWQGLTLGAIANALGETIEWMIELTPCLPEEKGFAPVAFDALNFSGGKPGYGLKLQTAQPNAALTAVAPLGEYNGTVVRFTNPASRISPAAAQSPLLKTEGVLRGSAQFAAAARIEPEARVEIALKSGKITRRFVLDKDLKGTVARLETFDLPPVIQGAIGYRYETVKIQPKGTGE